MTEHHPPDEQRSDEQREQRSDEQPRKRRRSRVRLDDIKAEWPVSGGLTLAGSGLVGTLVVVLAWWVFHHQSQVEVPNLVGMSRIVAEAQLKDRGLSLHTTYDEISDQPAGTVLRTDPAARTMLDPDGGVSLVLAVSRPLPTPPPGLELPPILKQPPVEVPAPVVPAPVVPPPAVLPAPVVVPPPAPVLRRVPDVIGLDRLRAERVLAAQDLTVGSVIAEASDHRAHTVLRTNPRAGTAVWPHSAVDLVLAQCAVRIVPNVLGFDRVRAARTLADNGLTMGSITEQGSDQRAQTVLRSNPAVGVAVPCGSAVDLVVAKPLVVPVPPLVGYDLTTAEKLLVARGLTVGSITEQVSDQRAQTVLQTNPVAGTWVRPGSTVSLVVAKPRAVSGDSTGNGGTSGGVPRMGGGDTRDGVPSGDRHTPPTDTPRHQPR
jgi:beta-lactam-binding protein with PASTA domain